ncbi:PQQ-dependent sugar dehydrogenase [Candidatus Saccharibacteria bacterium]|nr:PQQ-dependent sugar dehydrogenase [Candidatus Saccharibacteria bacterium]MCA9312731.1 PQQ-dependent sugar dehydrogenase [Candidatus Saccharibacteria bacterium]
MNRRTIVGVTGFITILMVTGFLFRDKFMAWFFRPTESSVEVGTQRPGVMNEDIKFGVFAENLDTPWSLVFLPDGDLLVSERSGSLKIIGKSGAIFPIEGVEETSEGGLLGVVLHPEFKKNKLLYLYATMRAGDGIQNQVSQYQLSDNVLTFQRVILGSIPADDNHNGGGLAFGPDNKLYITTGDTYVSSLAQNKSSLAGKILRINDDRSVPADNPFGNLIWSYGHRNPQGITWDEGGKMWSIEHGPSGSQGSGQDELNIIEKGGNYGWPIIKGDQQGTGMHTPVANSGVNETWAPAGIAYADGSVFFTGLRGQSLYQAVTSDTGFVALKRHFSSEYGRLRAISVKDKVLYFATSNKDGRGSPGVSDDRIFQAPLSILK